MKKFILNFKQTIRFLVSIIVSREFAFMYVIAGTIAQVAHTYYLTESISSLSGNWRTTQAVLLSIFISSSLLYFTAITDNEDTKESRKVHFAVTMFTIIEILINIYYYTRHIIIDNPNYKIFDFIFAILVSCLIPVTIKLYSSHIRAKEWIIDIENNKQALVGKSQIERGMGIVEHNEEISEPKIDIKFTDIDDKISEFNMMKDWSNLAKSEEYEIQNKEKIKEMIKDVVDEIEVIEPEEIEHDMSYIVEKSYQEKESTDPIDISDNSEDLIHNVDIAIKPYVDKFQKELEDLRNEFIEDPNNNEKINQWFDSKVKSINEEITANFEKNTNLFLQQFENKIKMIVNQNIKKIQNQ